MEPRLLLMFQRQVAMQCRIALIAADQLQEAINPEFMLRMNDDDFEGPNPIDLLWYTIQSLLGAAANISKAFWGQATREVQCERCGATQPAESRSDVELRRKPLRDSIGFDDSSPLKSVKLRNHLEHFDDRIETWWKKQGSLGTLENSGGGDRIIGPKRMFQPSTGLKEGWFRNFDDQTLTAVFWGEEFDLRPLIAEIRRILPLIETAIVATQDDIRRAATATAVVDPDLLARLNAKP